jgi:membrane protease YdiL (CAAX protease family)
MFIFVLFMIVSDSVRFSYLGISWNLAIGFFLFLCVSISEEIVIRGYILSNLQEIMGPKSAIILSSLFFGLFHITNDNFTMVGFFNIFLSGILLGLLCTSSNTVSAPIGLHWAWNFVQGSIAGFNVSGHHIEGIFSITCVAPISYSGGEFGAEGSIVLIPIILFFIYLVDRWFKIEGLKENRLWYHKRDNQV